MAVQEPQNIVDKYAGKVVGHFKKEKTGQFAKIIFSFLRANKKNPCIAIVTGKALKGCKCHTH